MFNPRVQMAPSFWDDVMALIQDGCATTSDDILRPTTTTVAVKVPKIPALDSENLMLAQSRPFLCERIINDAKLASNYRPLGAAYVVQCLVAALGTAEDPQQPARIEATLTDYQTDFQAFEWKTLVTWLGAVFCSHRAREPLKPSNVDVLAFEVQGACMTQLQAMFGL